jgi:tRNA (guanine37-N1)-methyltransferase
MQRIAVVTLFPQLIASYLEWGIIRKAQGFSLDLRIYDLRKHGLGLHQSVDDRPFGGGPGMVLRPDVLLSALEEVRQWLPEARVIAFSPSGERVQQKMFQKHAHSQEPFIFFCGRYEGFDQRFLDLYVDAQWSLGDFVLTGGELAALACIDAIARLHPGVLNDPLSSVLESFSNNLLDHPHYTKPLVFEGVKVPDVLMSGHHANIQSWRDDRAIALTTTLRPDLLD